MSAVQYAATTPEDEAAWIAFGKAKEALDVYFWHIGLDCRNADASITYGASLSPCFSTYEKAERALVEIEIKHPGAGIYEGCRFFSPLRPSDVLKRGQLLASLI